MNDLDIIELDLPQHYTNQVYGQSICLKSLATIGMNEIFPCFACYGEDEIYKFFKKS